MAKPDQSIEPRILKSAKEEFLLLGYKEASLKNICQKANVTTGALYKRYKGKDQLFCSIVEDAVRDLERIVDEKCSMDIKKLSDKELINTWYMDESYMMWWFEFLFSRHDQLVLLLRCAEGISYSNFQHDWVEKMNRGTYGNYCEARLRGLTDKDITTKEMHILITAFWSTIYEPFIHDFTWDEIKYHCKVEGAGAIKKMFTDDIENIELLLAHAFPEGSANLVIPLFVFIGMFFVTGNLRFYHFALFL